MKRPEILAPAGSMGSLTAALRAGADAVYAGGKRFSARSSAANLSDEELEEASRLCHLYGARLYIAVNTVITDSEAESFCRFIRYTSEIGTDGYIVQDWGAARLIKSIAPDAVLHASTQMSVHTAAGAELLGKLGFARAVPARELDKETLRRICSLDIENEIFVHGALCMSVSGQCYMSAMIGSRSANRGCCGQACRLPFSSCGSKDFQALSLKDMSLLPMISEAADIGVDSLKIEGRMKRPEYVAASVHELSRALDGEIPDMQLLGGIFSRSGFTDGYFSGNLSPGTMFGARSREDAAAARELFPAVHELYRTERQVHSVDISCTLRRGEPVRVKMSCGDVCAEADSGDILPQTAQNRPTGSDTLEKQLTKLGGTVFRPGSFSADIPEDEPGLFVPAGALNDLRRKAADRLSEAVIRRNTPVYHVTDYTPKLPEIRTAAAAGALPLRVYCTSPEQAEAALSFPGTEAVIADSFREDMISRLSPDRTIISPPRFITDESELLSRLSELKSRGFSRLLCHTPDSIAIGQGLGFELCGGFTLNVCNSYSTGYLQNIGLCGCILSPELKISQIREICRRTDSKFRTGAVVYGRLPLMLTRCCPIQNEVGCKRCTRLLKDRTNRCFPVKCSKAQGYTEILNADRLFMLDRLGELKDIDLGLVLLHDETPEETLRILSGEKPQGSITRGLYYRGFRETDEV
ncbi:MAG: U32 family peptidase [Ruminococcus sp.]|nr:U32 family peptidase [Ruminococcus sp.]